MTWTQDKISAFGDSVRSIINLLKRQDKGIVAIMGTTATAYAPYPMQIYVQDKAVLSKGTPVVAGQALCFASQANGPKDGIYTDCVLIFDEGSLILIQNNQPEFLSTIDEYAPVHSYDPKKGENQTLPAKRLATRNIKAKTAVVALNAKGTRIAAIYVIEV